MERKINSLNVNYTHAKLTTISPDTLNIFQ